MPAPVRPLPCRLLMRRMQLASALALIVSTLPLVSATATTTAGAGWDAAGSPRTSVSTGLLGDGVTGTGILPNFRERGEHLIRLQVGAFDPLREAAPRPAGAPVVSVEDLADWEPAYWLVQVQDERFGEARGAVEATGGIVAGYVPDDTFMVRASSVQVDAIAASASVRWTGLYQPAWKMPVAAAGLPGLLNLEGEQPYRVHFFDVEPDLRQALRALEAIPGVDVLHESAGTAEVRGDRAQLPAIASIPAVEWIDVKPEAQLLNANARWVNDTGVRDLYAATAAGRLTGAGQTAAVADTAVNYKYDLNGRAHIAFRDCNPDGSACKEAIYTQARPGTAGVLDVVDNNTNHRKMVAFFDLGSTGPNPFDTSSHGSHTAGSVTGDQPSPDGSYRKYDGDDGLAPGAMHVHQNIGTASGGLAIPGLYDLLRQAYRPRDPDSVGTSSGPNGTPSDYVAPNYIPLEDARTHNDSWGLIVPLVSDGDAEALDQFVWDHEDMVVVFSAGNDGPASGTIGSPSTGKNELSSAASANGRQPMSSIDSLAQFSSHGPTPDGRFGPDVATPGQIIVSVKGGTTDGYHTAQGTSMSAPVLTGLSTLVRQYFFDGYSAPGGDGFAAGAPNVGGARVHNPSAALVKASLINGAERMRGFYTGDDGNNAALDGQWPSAGQGYGRVSLNNSLYFNGDPTRNWYVDVYRGDTGPGAPAACPQGVGAADCTSFPVVNPMAPGPQQRTFQMHVAEGQPFDVTLAWTDAPNLLPAGTPGLVNDLNLVVTAPDGRTYVGNNMNTRSNPAADVEQTVAASGPTDTRNTSERVRIDAPVPGDYTIRVSAPAILEGNQGFALAASGDLSPATGGDTFAQGPPLQADVPGNPALEGAVRVRPISSDTAQLLFTTNEPTTAVATVARGTATERKYEDSYVEDPADGGFPGLNEDIAYIETSREYADRLVVTRNHEILLTGLSGGRTPVELEIKDMAGNAATSSVDVTTPANVFQPQAGDIAHCVSGQPDCQWAGLPHDMGPRPVPPGRAAPPAPNDNYATQMYASGRTNLGAYMFRLPDGAIDPSAITGAVVEMTSAHNWVVQYTNDPVFTVDLLSEGVEASWRSQSYSSIRNAARVGRAYPETAYERGGYERYAFTFACNDLAALRKSLENDQAAFRWDSNGGGLFSMDIGFQRRSRGPDMRPRLVLTTKDQPYAATEPCDPATPAPKISEVGIHPGTTKGGVTVSWKTDVASDSTVLFREDGSTDWTQVATPALTKVHHVEVLGLDPKKEYAFAVRSVACNGQTTTDTNQGRGYDFFRRPFDPGPRTVVTEYDFEAGPDGWTAANIDTHSTLPPDPTVTPDPRDATWTRDHDGASDTQDADGSRDADAAKYAWHVEPYHEYDETTLTSPPVTIPGGTVGVEFFARLDTEPDFDFLYVEYSQDGITWNTAEAFTGLNEHYPAYDPFDVRFGHPSPGSPIEVRFRLFSDQLIASPVHEGVAVDKVALASYPDAPPPTEALPRTGPVPPPSADETGLIPPATRLDLLTRDLAAGTGVCGGRDVVLPEIDITFPANDTLVPAGILHVTGTASVGTFDAASGAGPPTVMIHATDGKDYTQEVPATSSNRFRSWSADLDLTEQQRDQITITATLRLGPDQVALDRVNVVVRGADAGGGGGRSDLKGCGRVAKLQGINKLFGTPGKDLLIGTSAPDAICGGPGKDVVKGLDGNDILVGGKANDRISGGGGNDRIYLGAGNDRSSGGKGKDRLVGFKGNDVLKGGGQRDSLNGQAGKDSCKGGPGKDVLKRCETESK